MEMRLETIDSPGIRLRPLPRRLSPLRLLERLMFWCDRAAQRRRLAQLDDRMLRDIGVGRAEAYRESSKLFWQD
jgi:uncharacterized protein YjiS (DUF1127 family)